MTDQASALAFLNLNDRKAITEQLIKEAYARRWNENKEDQQWLMECNAAKRLAREHLATLRSDNGLVDLNDIAGLSEVDKKANSRARVQRTALWFLLLMMVILFATGVGVAVVTTSNS